MTVTYQIKFFNRKIMQDEVQYDLDRKATKISALYSNNLDKYKYLTGEDLGLKPSTVEEARFEYSPLGKSFNKGLDKDDQKEGLFKRLKNIENAQKNLIRADDNESLYYTSRSEFDDKDDKYKKTKQNNKIDTKPPNVSQYLKSLSQEAEDLMDEIEEVNDESTIVNFFLLVVVIRKNLTLTLLINH